MRKKVVLPEAAQKVMRLREKWLDTTPRHPEHSRRMKEYFTALDALSLADQAAIDEWYYQRLLERNKEAGSAPRRRRVAEAPIEASGDEE